jgi:hypothetical protein
VKVKVLLGAQMHFEVVLADEPVPAAGHGTREGPALVIVVHGACEVVKRRGLLEDPFTLPALAQANARIRVIIVRDGVGSLALGVYQAGQAEVGGADVVLEVGLGDEILPARVVGVEQCEVGDGVDVEGSAHVALAVVCCADVHCEVGLLGEGLGASKISARDILALCQRGPGVLALDVLLESRLTGAPSVTEWAIGVLLLDMGLKLRFRCEPYVQAAPVGTYRTWDDALRAEVTRHAMYSVFVLS